MENVTIGILVDIIQSIGFPMFVAGWLMLRSDKKEAETKEALQKIEIAITRMCERLPRVNGERRD